ncbi:MAG: stage II sporulation protein M [Methanosarcinales archaeon]|nr:stage II sporulation protein M [Methanosarcinales archaeon]MCD4798395.1 stage II sporulation protein M [Methanosarcinales archaeon]
MNQNEQYYFSTGKGFTAEAMAYLTSLRPYLLVIITLFLLATAVGYVSAYFNPDIIDELIGQFEETYGWIAEESPIMIMLFIFANNTLNSFIAMLLGIFFGIWPVIFILVNGYFIGVVVFSSVQEYGILVVLFALLPHGIIELPMIFISASMGLRLGVLAFQKIFRIKEEEIRFKYELFSAIRFFVTVIVPLLFIAAIIETFITSTILYILTS